MSADRPGGAAGPKTVVKQTGAHCPFFNLKKKKKKKKKKSGQPK
jgi:hypothetical protein